MNLKKTKKGGAHLAKKTRAPKVKKEKKARTRKEKIRLAVIIALVVLAVLLALFITVLLIHSSLVKRPTISDPLPEKTDETGKHVVEGVEPGGDRKKDFYTFLVVGRDTGGGGNTDTILLAAYDIPNQQLNVMSIPRDTMVNVPWDLKKINSVYNGYGGGDEGIDALYNEVSHLVCFVPDYSVVVEWKAVGELVDAIGGVWFDVPRNMNYDDPTQNLHIHQSKGYRLLNGDDAMQVIRWRQNNDGSGYSMGDIERIETQQAFLKAVVEQCLKVENVKNINQIAKVFTENVQTDLTIGNLVWLAEQAALGGLASENVNFITLPGNYSATAWSRKLGKYESYVLPYGDELLEVVNESFNPYLEDRTAASQDIMSVNSDGSLSSTSGVVKDTPAASPPFASKSSSTTTPKAETTPSTTTTPKPSTESNPTPNSSQNTSTAPNVTTTPAPENNVTPSPAATGTPDEQEEPPVDEPPASPPPEDTEDPGEVENTADTPPSEEDTPQETSDENTPPPAETVSEPPAEAVSEPPAVELPIFIPPANVVVPE